MIFYFLNTDVSICIAIFLLIIFIYTYKQLDKNNTFILILKALTYSCIITIISEAFNSMMKHETIHYYTSFNLFLHSITFSGGCLIPYLFGLFVAKYLTPEKLKLTVPFMVTYSLPAVIYMALIIFVNPSQHIFFSLTESGNYIRGTYFLASFLPAILYMSFTFIYLIANRKYTSFKKFVFLLIVSAFPLIGCVLQTLIYGLLIMYPAVGITIILIYVYLQNELVLFDNITRAEKMSTLENKLAECEKNKNHDFSLAYFDINNLYAINQNHGHVEGNLVLKEFANCIIKNLEEGSFLARSGGDEFIAYINTKDVSKITTILEKIKQDFENLNILGKKNETITYSSAFTPFDEDKYLNSNQLISNLENQIFEIKNSKVKGV